MTFLNGQKILYKKQFGFQKNFSTANAIIRPIILNLSFMVISFVNIMMLDMMIILLFSNKSALFFCKYKHFS